MDKKNIISYLLCVLLLVVLVLVLDVSKLSILLDVSISSFLISVFIALLMYIVSGIQYYFIRKQFGVSLKKIDIIFLPIVGNLWSFIFPFQGNLLFTTVFFKQRYNMKVSESFSISIYLYLITVCFTGLFGILFSLYNHLLFSWIGGLSFIFLINPLIIYTVNIVFEKIGTTKNKYVAKIQSFFSSVISNTNNLWLNSQFTLIMLLIAIFKISLSIVWFYWISISLGFNLSFLAVGLISLIMSISIIIKFTPGNMGIAQLITGGAMSIIGGSAEQAVLITLFASATTITLIFTIGLYGNFYYFKSINLNTLIKRKN